LISLKETIQTLLSNAWQTFRFCWSELVLTSVVYRIIAFVVLTPMLGVLIRSLLWVSGESVLADQDILHFFLGPAGWVSAIIGVSALATVAVSEQAALLVIIRAGAEGKRVGPLEALQFAAGQAWPLLRFTAQVVFRVLLILAPFGGLIGLVYFSLLSRHDINYYLQHRPTEFLVAVAIAGLIATTLCVILARILLRWLLAVPLLLFEGVEPRLALKTSAQRTRRKYLAMLCWLTAWILFSILLASAFSAPVGIFGRWLMPLLAETLSGALLGVGLLLLALFVSNLVASVLAWIAFSLTLFNLYRPRARMSQESISQQPKRSRILENLTATRAVLALAGLTLAAAAVGGLALRSIRFEDRTLVTAHRGASSSAPENTLAAIRQAMEDGADYVEIDVQETVDGHVVLFHDSDFMRVANTELKIWEAKLSHLEQIDVGSHFSPQFEKERVPTLEQVLVECKGNIGINIELKSYGYEQDLERRVISLVEEHGMEAEIVLMSLKREIVNRSKTLRPEWRVGLLTAVAIGDLASLDVDFLAIQEGLVDRDLIRSAHRSGKEVWVWTVNDPITMSTLISRGIDNLITDKPAMARRVLVEREGLSSMERLLVEVAGLLGGAPEYNLTLEDF
jgi:glycerophosphoryl diester phosphodiesterase